MRNGREGLAGIVREVMVHNPKCYDEAFIFYSKDYRKVKILHYDLNGYPMTPSLAAFYLDQKIGYGMSEERILQMLAQMGGNIPQSTLNGWAHDVMGYLKDRLQEPMKDSIKLSVYTHNDGTHIIVRSWNEEKGCFEYHVEWIHGVLSPDMKTVVMLYEDGSRSHTIQEEEIFKGSNIKSFIAGRL